MGTLGQPRRLDHKYKFTVEVDGFRSAAFKACSSLEFEVADVDYWEGGAIIPVKEPGRVTVPDITLDRGVGLDRDMHDWALECIDFTKQGGAVPQELKRNLEVVQRARDGSEVRRVTAFNCYPKKYVFGEWDNDSDEVVIEQLVLRYDFPKDTTDE
jgi:phage tail-like protein